MQQLQVTVASARTQADAKITAIRDSSYEQQADGKSVAVIVNDFIEYRAKTERVSNPAFATQYAEFADWSSRLNAVTQPKLPPYLRMDLNRLVAEHGAIPTEIVRRTHQGGRELVLTSRLLPIWRLSQDDHARIARCATMIAEFQEIPERDYWHAPEVIQASAQLSKAK